MLVSDYVIQFLVDRGVNDLFLVSGGGIMYLLDSVGRNKDVKYYCNYHEQACVAAAEAYARVRNGVGACLVTTGPGAANALSAIPAAWVDSVPLMVICGQNKRELIADYSKLRQLGPQEANVVGMAAAVTKYAKCIHDPKMIRYELEFAWHQATSGRPGPVLLEIPVDVQGTDIDATQLHGFVPGNDAGDKNHVRASAENVLAEIRKAKRPILICGNGIQRADAQQKLFRLLESLKVPVLVPLTAKDVIYEDHPMNMGVFGTAGQRRANFALQSADLFVAMGAGLNSQKVGFNVAGFAPKAKKIVVDIDRNQLDYQVIKPDLAIQADVADLLDAMIAIVETNPYSAPERWLLACEQWKKRYLTLMDDYFSDKKHVNSYVFHNRLSQLVTAEDVLVTGNALDTTSYFQSFTVKKGQRTFNSGWGAMGWCLPMAIGACVGSKRRTICVTGDGSFQFNSQELLTMKQYGLDIKVFIFNNDGYSNIRGTQENFFQGRYVAVDPGSGVATPNFAKLADAYGFGYSQIHNNDDLIEGIKDALAKHGPVLCEVNISPAQRILPKASAFRREDGTFESRPLEDMAPFLSREEVWENMHQFDDE